MIFNSHHHLHPHHITHHYIKQCQWNDATMCFPPGGLKVRAVVTVLSCYDLLVDPEGFKEITHIWNHAVYLQIPDEADAVYSVVGLPHVENNMKRVSWSTPERSWASLSSMVTVTVHLPAWNPCSTCLNWMLAPSRVLMMASTNFHSASRRLITRVSMFPLGINTRIVHPNYYGIYLVLHMYWTMSRSYIRLSGFFWGGGGVAPSPR